MPPPHRDDPYKEFNFHVELARVPAGRVSIAVEYERPGGKRRVTKVAHDLEVFRELAYVL